MIKPVVLASVLFTVTLFGGGALVQARSQGLSSPTSAARSYLCFEGGSAKEVMVKANEAGARGWRMIASAPSGRSSVWCFEQLAAARPLSR